ncbi:MAG: cytochrome c [Hyphomicrobiaceae bacterium]|nr:cytochrome c [Hyphomicrobiaceae bacterium]
MRVMALGSILTSAAAPTADADVAKGRELARMWCASCHIIANNPTGPVPQGPPSFQAIADSGMAPDQLRAFLSHPHGAMPNLTLTRSEIDDLIGYITSLR